jgi:hypothetical protein
MRIIILEHKMKMVIAFFIINTILTVTLLSTPNSSYAQESDSGTTLVSSDDKIIMVRDLLTPTNNKLDFTFYVYNTGNDTAKELRIIPSSLSIKEGSRFFSSAPTYIGRDSLMIEWNGTKLESHQTLQLESNQILKIDFIMNETLLNEIGFNEATYVGTVQIVGQNVEPLTISFEINFRYDPWLYFGFTLGGVAGAIISGHFAYTRWEKYEEMRKKMDDDVDIIKDINGHITSINTFKNTIHPSAWKNIRKAYEQKKKEIEGAVKKFELEPGAEAVRWFELTDKRIHEDRIFQKDEPSTEERIDLEKLKLPSEKDKRKTFRDEMKEQKEDNWKMIRFIFKRELEAEEEDRTLRVIGIKKTVYVIAVAVLSSFASILTNASFLGNLGITALVAFAIGFATYRAQDIVKVLSPKNEAK